MLFAAAVLVFLACWVALLHWHGCVSEEQAAEARRLEEWTRRLVKYEASRPVPYDQERSECTLNQPVDEAVWQRIQSINRSWFK